VNLQVPSIRRWFSEWKLTTVRTFLTRLVEKGYLQPQVPHEVVLDSLGPHKVSVIDHLTELLGDRDRAIEIGVEAGRRPVVIDTVSSTDEAATIATDLRELGAVAFTREGIARYAPRLDRREALEEETSAFLDLVAGHSPASCDLIIERALQRKAELVASGSGRGER
jgi:predicted transcriptional regulator